MEQEDSRLSCFRERDRSIGDISENFLNVPNTAEKLADNLAINAVLSCLSGCFLQLLVHLDLRKLLSKKCCFYGSVQSSLVGEVCFVSWGFHTHRLATYHHSDEPL